MSYGVSFIAKGPDQTWDEALEQAEGAAGADVQLDDEARASADRVIARALEILPEADVFSDDDHVEVSDPASGLQLSVFASEAGLTIPYWHEGPRAESVMAIAHRLARMIEAETGWLGWDPQRGAPFTGEGLTETASELEHGTRIARNVATPEPRPWWKFW